MPSRLQQQASPCQARIAFSSAFFCELLWFYGSDGGRHLVPLTERLVGPPVPTCSAAGAPQIQALEHQPEYAGVHLDMPPPYGRLSREFERSPLQLLVQEQVPRSVPHQNLDSVTAPVEVAKEMAAER